MLKLPTLLFTNVLNSTFLCICLWFEPGLGNGARKTKRMRITVPLCPHFWKMAGVEELYKCFGVLADAGDTIAEVLYTVLFDTSLEICTSLCKVDPFDRLCELPVSHFAIFAAIVYNQYGIGDFFVSQICTIYSECYHQHMQPLFR